MDVKLLKLLSLSLFLGFAINNTVQAADFPSLDKAVPGGGNTEKYAPVFDFDGDGCLPSAGISRDGIRNPGLRTTGSITGQCRSPYFLATSNTLHRYACITSGGFDYCGHFYSLYFEKDQCYGAQALPDPVCGHRHDWEYAAVWTINGVITHGGVSAHGDLESKPITQLAREGDHFKVVYHKDAMGGGAHALRFADHNENAENPYGMFVTPVLISWYELAGDGPNNEQMRWNLNNFCYNCCSGWPDDVCGGTIPLKDTNDTFLNELNTYKPPGYPTFTQASIEAANPNNPVLEMISGGDGTFTADDTDYLVDFGIVHIPLIGSRWLSAELMVINQVLEPADSLDGYFDISAAAPYLTTGFEEFTGLAAGDFIDGLVVEISTAGYGPGHMVGEIEFQPKGLVDTGARELLDAITLNISLELRPPVDEVVAGLPDSSIRTNGNRTALVNFLKHARANALSGNTAQAMRMLQKALERTDGCVLRGVPDTQAVAPLAKDYIVNCPDQELVYALINDELSAIAGNSAADANSFNTASIVTATPPPGQPSNASGGGSFGLFALAALMAAVMTKKII
jgi:hypothetical protein